MKLSIQIQNINLGFFGVRHLSMANVYSCSLADSKWNKRLSEKEKKTSFNATIFLKDFSGYSNSLRAE